MAIFLKFPTFKWTFYSLKKQEEKKNVLHVALSTQNLATNSCRKTSQERPVQDCWWKDQFWFGEQRSLLLECFIFIRKQTRGNGWFHALIFYFYFLGWGWLETLALKVGHDLKFVYCPVDFFTLNYLANIPSYFPS